MSKCALGCADLASAVYFDVAKLSKHSTSRIYQWKLACGVDDGDFSVCNRHFFLKQPSNPTDEDHPDWVPWLNMQPGKQDDPAEVQRRMQQYYAGSRAASGGVCCIVSCANASSEPNANVSLFDFPELGCSDYTQRILSEKRLFCWMKVIDQPELWQRAHLRTLKICSEHFTSGRMAALTDVKNIDWIPTQGLKKKTRITDHMGYFGLGNLVTLTENDLNMPKESKVCPPSKIKPPDAKGSKSLINVGFKCILCLSNAALKPLTNSHRATIDKFFQKKLRVQSELICGKCCKLITEFDEYWESILKIQKNVTVGTIKSIIPIQAVSNQPTNVTVAPIKSIIPIQPISVVSNLPNPFPVKTPIKIAPAPPPPASTKNSKNQLYEELPGNTFRCTLCKQVETFKPAMNNHLHQAHKVKIYCKLCKTSFSPNGFEGHKSSCSGNNRPIGVRPIMPKTVNPKPATIAQNTATIPMTSAKPSEKYSCYICAKFFTPDEMKEHILTHTRRFPGIDNKKYSCYICSQFFTPDMMKDHILTHSAGQKVLDNDIELCKDPSCQRAIHKSEKEKHEQEHEQERAKIRERQQQYEARKIYSCAACQVGFISAELLEVHRKHHTVFTCKDCNAEFKNFRTFAKHQQEHLPANGEAFRIKAQVRESVARQKKGLQNSKAAAPTTSGSSSSNMDLDGMVANAEDTVFDPEQYVQSAFTGSD